MNAEQCQNLKNEAEHNLHMLTWGTYGINSNLPLTYKPLTELDTEHLENIIISQQSNLSKQHNAAILVILKQRYTQQDSSTPEELKETLAHIKMLDGAILPVHMPTLIKYMPDKLVNITITNRNEILTTITTKIQHTPMFTKTFSQSDGNYIKSIRFNDTI